MPVTVGKGFLFRVTFFFLALRAQGLDSGGVCVANIDRTVIAASRGGKGPVLEGHRQVVLLMERSWTGDNGSHLGKEAARDLDRCSCYFSCFSLVSPHWRI